MFGVRSLARHSVIFFVKVDFAASVLRKKIMKASRTLILWSVLSIAGAMELSATPILQCEPVGNNLRLIFTSQTGTNYQLQVSTNLLIWEDSGGLITGNGLSQTQTVSTLNQPMAFFRVRATQTSADVAPSTAEFTALVVEKMLFDYSMLSPTRFSYVDNTGTFPGNWTYTKTSGDQATLVFTYDDGNNDPTAYREEILLTFQTPTQGSYRYSEYYSNFEYLPSVSTGQFDLSNL